MLILFFCSCQLDNYLLSYYLYKFHRIPTQLSAGMGMTKVDETTGADLAFFQGGGV